ncbi:MAG: hypothetical protein KJ065_02140 [Anaerolineae bacterium]|nr:hypothetical protein [Anaerolineae bacterium]
MVTWMSHLSHDPLPPLLNAPHEAIRTFARRDLLGEPVPPVARLWQLPEPVKILKKQRVDGAWVYPGSVKDHLRAQEDYDQIETYRVLGYLVEKYGFTRQHPAIEHAGAFLLAHQTGEGDIRGIYGQQYSPNYSAAIMELLIKAGCGDDPRIEHGFRWLLCMRQRDGGWASAIRTRGVKIDSDVMLGPTLTPDVDKPFSHLFTGVVLRAFAAHPGYRHCEEARQAGRLLASRFFEKDSSYPDRGTPDYWTRFTFPFWFTDLLSALDALSWLGFSATEPKIAEALDWFATHQDEDGVWRLKLLKMSGEPARDLWISLAICRVLRRFWGDSNFATQGSGQGSL